MISDYLPVGLMSESGFTGLLNVRQKPNPWRFRLERCITDEVYMSVLMWNGRFTHKDSKWPASRNTILKLLRYLPMLPTTLLTACNRGFRSIVLVWVSSNQLFSLCSVVFGIIIACYELLLHILKCCFPGCFWYIPEKQIWVPHKQVVP